MVMMVNRKKGPWKYQLILGKITADATNKKIFRNHFSSSQCCSFKGEKITKNNKKLGFL